MRTRAKERVLLVDDEPEVLVALEDLLDDSFIVVKAETPEKALHLLEDDPEIAVIITDQRMPTMSGAEFLSRVGDKSKALRILVTGYSDLSAVIRSVNEGRIFGYATKPWDPHDLLSKVDKAAEHFRLGQQLARERELLREQTEILNAVLESVGDGVVVTDRSGKFLLFNQQAERLLGISHTETSLDRWADDCGVLLGDRVTRVPAEDPLVRGMVERVETEVVIHNRAVRNLTVAVTASPLLRGKSVTGSVALLRDVTERRILEQRLLQAQKMEAIGQLAGGVAHDFNNLLAVIQSCGELVRQDLPAGVPMHEDMEQLLGATRRATTLTRQLLAFGRRQVLQPRLVDLNTLVLDMEKMLRRLLGEGLELDTELASSLSMVKADEAQLEQIVLNLVVNARDAMPSGGKITVRTRNLRLEQPAGESEFGLRAGDFVLLSVEDGGIGMSPETQRRIFEPFFTTKDVGKGTGLGLSTVHGIVEQSGGHLRIDSEIGRGTRFDVYFPAVGGIAQNLRKPGSVLGEEGRAESAAKRS